MGKRPQGFTQARAVVQDGLLKKAGKPDVFRSCGVRHAV